MVGFLNIYPMITIYKITLNNVPLYYGKSNNIKRRTKQHNKLLLTSDKPLYEFLRSNLITNIELEIIEEFDCPIEASRKEAFLILDNYFNGRTILQSIPKSFRYF